MERLVMRYGKKLKKLLKKMLKFSTSYKASPVSPTPCAVHCEDLFLQSAGRKEKDRRRRDYDDDPFTAGYIAAQNYFTLRPNIYM